jgi:hypothetical protein
MRDYGIWGKPLQIFEMFEDFRDDPDVLAALQEGTGSPEGRADFPYFLQTVIRNRMRERYAAVAAKWQQYTGRESAQDFRETTITQLNGLWGMDRIPEFGEYPRLRSSEEPGPAFAVAKHGGIYEVTMELVINDEADTILGRIPREIGRMAGEYVSLVVVRYIESNPTYIDGQPFFSAAHLNEVTGAGAQPNEDNLVTIIEAMKTRRDANGVPYSLEPSKILVRSQRQKLTFNRILRSQQTGVTVAYDTTTQGGTKFDRGTDNPLYGIMPPDAVIDEPWLNDPDDWYMLARIDDRPGFIVAFLRGRTEPFIGRATAQVAGLGGGDDPYTMEFDSIPFKVRHIFGTGMGDPNAMHRMRPS